MDKNATTPLRVIIISVFALSCFSLLLFLWLSFGGSVPLKAEGYQVKAAFPDAVSLAEQADVRAAGVPIGKVVYKELDPQGNRTLATIRIDPEFAPLRSDVRAILRQKTLLGETFVELTTGTKGAKMIPEGGRIDDARVAPTVEFDEMLRVFDPDTRQAFQTWQEELARSAKGRGEDLNDALGNLPVFTEGATDVLTVLDRKRVALKSLINDTGTTFEAITRDENELRRMITETATVFDTTAANSDRLAETIRILPTFQRETRATLARLQTFTRETEPLLDDLEPALEDLQPALVDLRRLSPDLANLFRDLNPLITSSETGLPSLNRVLRGLSPVFRQTTPFLQQLNPILQYISTNQYVVTEFISMGANATNNKLRPENGSTGHALPQLIVAGSQTLPAAQRTKDNRGTTYWKPGAFADPRLGAEGSLPSWDCNHVGERDFDSTGPACYVQEPIPFQGMTKKFPNIQENSYRDDG